MPYRINLIARNNGVGLTRDLHLLATTLQEGGHTVTVTGIRRGKITKWLRPLALRLTWGFRRLVCGSRAATHDINLMIEHVWPDDARFAPRNILIPNPEWLLPRDQKRLNLVDHFFVKTRHAEALFNPLGPTTYIGFTSEDRLDAEVAREDAFFHLAGRSGSKGTERLLALWRRHPEWPRLTVVQSPHNAHPGAPAGNIDHRIGYMDDGQLKTLQNSHRFHLCPSETEGYGHYIVEAASIGAVTITVDAPPMNELIDATRGKLVSVETGTGTQHLATTYFFDEAQMEAVIEDVIAARATAHQQLGAAARSWFVANDQAFAQRLLAAIASV